MKKINLLLLILICSFSLWAQNVIFNNVSVNPNPFSPNSDGQRDVTNISFYLYYPESIISPQYKLKVFQNNDTTDVVYNTTQNATNGLNQFVWDGRNNSGVVLSDNKYGFKLEFNQSGYQRDFVSYNGIIIKTIAPDIQMISAFPNPFSPNGDGFQDAQTIKFKVKNADVYYLGTLRINLSDTTAVYTDGPYAIPHSDGAYVFVNRPAFYNSLISIPANTEYALTIGANSVNVTLGSSLYKFGTTYDRYYTIGNNVRMSPTELFSGIDYLAVYAVSGNLSLNIYNNDGSELALTDLYKNYYGSFMDNPLNPSIIDASVGRDYAFNIGSTEGQIPGAELEDGRYIYRTTISNEVENDNQISGEFLVNNNPIAITGNANPNKISPQKTDGVFDQSVIQYTPTEDAFVTVKIWNSANQLIRTIIQNQLSSAGVGNFVLWDGRDNNGNIVSMNSEAQYRIEISATDRYINNDATSLNIPILVDNLAPVSPTLYQTQPDSLNTALLSISGLSDQINSEIILYQNGVEKGVVATTPAYPGYFTFNVTLEEGVNVLSVKLRDAVFNLGANSNVISYYLDSQSPVITSVIPESNTNFTSLPVNVSALVTDNGVGVNQVRFGFSLNESTNLNWVTGTVSVNNPNLYTAQVPINPTVSQLNISMVVQASDFLNNTVQTANPITFNYIRPSATNPPIFVSSYPENNSNISSVTDNSFKISINSESPLLSNNESTYIRIFNQSNNDSLTAGVGATLNYSNENNLYTLMLNLDSPLTPDGSFDANYLMKYRAESQAGHVITGNIAFNYDTTKPVVNSIKINNSYLQQVNNIKYFAGQIDSISVYLSDNLSGIDYSANLSRVSLFNQNNQIVNGIRTLDQNTGRITWKLNNPITMNEANLGNYTISVNSTDKAGNLYTGTSTFALINPTTPQILEHIPVDNAKINVLANNRISKKIMDRNTFGLDRTNSNIVVLRGANIAYQSGVNASLSFTELSNNLYNVSLNLTDPMENDGSDDGLYTINTTIVDTLNQSVTNSTSFTYDTQSPIVNNTTIGGSDNSVPWSAALVNNTTINQSVNYVSINLSDLTTSVNFSSANTFIKIYKSDNQLLAGAQSLSGNDLKWTLSTPISNNGTMDGAYYVSYSATDLAGNIITNRIDFRVINHSAPQITQIIPANNAIFNNLANNEIYVDFHDERTIDLLDFSISYIKLITPSNTIIQHNQNATQVITSLGNNNYRMKLTVNPALSLNGQYTVQVRIQNTQSYNVSLNNYFVFDNQIPLIQSVRLGLLNGSEITVVNNDQVYHGISYIKVFLSDQSSGINYISDSTFVIPSSNNQVIPGSLVKDSAENYLKYTFNNSLSEIGTNIAINISALDKANNRTTSQLGFVLNALQANIISISPANNSYVNTTFQEVKLVVEYAQNINLNTNTTYIRLKHPDGSYIEPGQGGAMSFNSLGSNRYEISFRLNQALLENGQDDGEYKIYIQLATDNFQEYPTYNFTYDRLTPYYENLSINDIIVSAGGRKAFVKSKLKAKKQRNEYIFSQPITQILTDFSDITSNVNFTSNLTTITLLNPNGALVQGTRIIENNTVKWVLNNAIPVDGTKDGLYTISLKATDFAGNTLSSSYQFSLMSFIIPQMLAYTPENVLNHYTNSFTSGLITATFKNTIPVIQNPTQTYITMTFPNGNIASHNQGALLSYELDGTNLKTNFQLIGSLSTNGENDGKFNVRFHATNAYNAEYDDSLAFIYDTTKPSYSQLNAVLGNNSLTSLSENSIITQNVNAVQVKFSDLTAGIHYSPNISFISILDRNANLMPGNLVYTGEGEDTITKWILTNPIITDGSADGIYKIKLLITDKAGNSIEKLIPFNVISILPPSNVVTYLDAVYKVHVSWNSPFIAKKNAKTRVISKYQVYRKYENQEYTLLTQTANLYYMDNLQQLPDGNYQYMVKAVYSVENSTQEILSAPAYATQLNIKRFVPCAFTLRLSDNQTPENIHLHLLGNDGIYNQEFNLVTTPSGIISLVNVFSDEYILTLSKTGYQTIIDTITIDVTTPEFNYTLQTDIPGLYGQPERYALYQNFPNPFNPNTEIRYALKNDSRVDLSIYNVKGQKIKQLVNNPQTMGYHKVMWNGTDTIGKKVSSGIYFYVISVKNQKESYRDIKKMILMK